MALRAEAQSESSFSAQSFRPSAHGEAFFSVESGAIAPSLGVQTSLFFDYTNRPLEIARTSTTTFVLIEHRLDAQLAASVSLFDRLSVAIALPFTLFQRGFFSDQTGRGPLQNNTSLGDLRLEPKVGILDQKRHFLDLAVLLSLSLPTGNEAAFAGDKSVTFAAELDLSRAAGPLRFGLNFGYMYRATSTFFTASIGQELFARAAASLDLARTGARIPLEIILELYGRAAVSRPFSVIVENPLEAVLGARYKILPSLALNAGVGRGITGGYGSPVVRAFFGLSFTPLSGYKKAEPVAASAPVMIAATAPASEPASQPTSQPASAESASLPLEAIALDEDGVLPSRIYFFRRSDVISPDAWDVVDVVAQTMLEHPSLSIIVEGHSDFLGAESFNVALSQRRADAIVTALIARGIAAERLRSIGLGSKNPLAQGRDKAARDKNRCVVFRPLSDKKEDAQ